MEQFLKDPEILSLLAAIKERGLDKKHYTDIVDARGNQYVDLVQEGGGVLGIALTGYTYILEKTGIRFFSLAGTSAGAINTLLIAGTGRIGEPVSEIILEILSEKRLADFVDGDSRIKKLIQRYIDKKPWLRLHILLNSIKIWRVLKKRLGINPGYEFEQWITGILKHYNINTLSDLNEFRLQLPVLFDRTGKGTVIKRIPDIQIIAADITTKSKIVFPKMAGLYWAEPDKVNPAKFIRASMSIPFFFRPFEIDNIPDAGSFEDPLNSKFSTSWQRNTGYYGKIPNSVSFIDGGILSNFPINAFHLKHAVPKKPTFGVKLSTWKGSSSDTSTLRGMITAIISTMRQVHDYDFIHKNPDYNNLICYINADDEFNWLDFNLSKAKQVALFKLGAARAFNFLENFDWEKYKNSRISQKPTGEQGLSE